MQSFLRFLLFLAVVALFTPCVLAQSDSERIIHSAVEASDWTTALTELNKLRNLDPAKFRAGSYTYLLARVAERSGDFATATAGYQAVVSANERFTPYALWHLAHLARVNGDLVLEREQLRKLLALAPTSLLVNGAALRLAESYFESGDFGSAAESAKRIQPASVSATRQANALLGQAYARSGRENEARVLFNRLLAQMPDASRPDDFALTAVRELDALDKKTTPAPGLSEPDHLLRASVYQFNRDFSGARPHYQAILDASPQTGAVPNATYQLARGLYLESKYAAAVPLFQRVADQFPTSTTARDAWANLASTFLRLKRTDEAVGAYQQLIARFPEAPNPERPYLNIIDALYEGQRYPEALAAVQQTRARFKNDIGNALALFAQLRIHLALNSWAAAVADADELLRLGDLGGTRVNGGTTMAEVNFLRADALEQQGRIEEAISAYLAIPDGRNEYYGARATRRLEQLASNARSANLVQARLNAFLSAARTANANSQSEQARVAMQSALRLTNDANIKEQVLRDLRPLYQSLAAYKLQAYSPQVLIEKTGVTADSNPHVQLAAAFIDLGLYDEAIPELVASKPQQNAAPADSAFTLAVSALRGGFANRAVRFAEQVWKPVPADYVIELAPRELAELLYPAPYRDLLLKHTTPRAVDPRFVLSIARQESRYQTDAKSVSAARGMMQFIPATANDVAAELNLTNFNQDDLYDAGTAILFGSQYLAKLFQQFPDQPDAVAASYNGGADNMARWKERSRSGEPDRYVSEIGYAQSKDYVFKVMSNFWNYQRLYDSQLRPQGGPTK